MIYQVKLRRNVPETIEGAVVASSAEEAVDKIILSAEGSPRNWEVVSVREVLTDDSVQDIVEDREDSGGADHFGPGTLQVG